MQPDADYSHASADGGVYYVLANPSLDGIHWAVWNPSIEILTFKVLSRLTEVLNTNKFLGYG